MKKFLTVFRVKRGRFPKDGGWFPVPRRGGYLLARWALKNKMCSGMEPGLVLEGMVGRGE